MDSGRVRRRLNARLLAVCVVLAGLFLMHGSPAGAAGGCAAAMSAAQSPTSTAHHRAPTANPMDAAPTVARPDGVTRATAVMPVTHGSSCVSTPAHGRTVLPGPGLLAVIAVAAWATGTWAGGRVVGGRTEQRGPPMGGRGLLTRECVART